MALIDRWEAESLEWPQSFEGVYHSLQVAGKYQKHRCAKELRAVIGESL